jgi:putative membrane protein
MMGGYGFGGMLFGGLLMLAFWVLVIAGVIWLVVMLTRGASASASRANIGVSPTGQTSLDILKARYAKGEITKEQFEAMRRDLGA